MPAKGQFENLIGQKFGKLTVKELLCQNGYGHRWWHCICDCDGKRTNNVAGHNLKSGNVKSCGCLNKKSKNLSVRTHGDSSFDHKTNDLRKNTKIYRTWSGIKGRCLSVTNKDYHRYGARGITIYKPWIKDYAKFRDYVLSLDDAPVNDKTANAALQIDRIKNHKGYVPGNLRWATVKEQANNRKSSIKRLYKGKQRTLSEISDIVGLPYKLLNDRMYAGHSLKEAIKMGPSRQKKAA